MQVLFFTPAMRDALVQHVPDPGSEFSLTDEMSLLFRMLATAAQGTVCQVGRAGWRGWAGCVRGWAGVAPPGRVQLASCRVCIPHR